MKSPLFLLDKEKLCILEDTEVSVLNPKDLNVYTLLFKNTTYDDYLRLKDTYPTWDMVTTIANEHSLLSENESYLAKPATAHCMESFLKPSTDACFFEKDKQFLSIGRIFHNIVINTANSEILGFFSGSFSLDSAPNLKPDTDDTYKSGIQVCCKLEAIELAPAARGMGIGKIAAKHINASGEVFLNSALSQLTPEKLEGLILEPIVFADIQSKSGARWAEHVFEGFRNMALRILPQYTDESMLEEPSLETVM